LGNLQHANRECKAGLSLFLTFICEENEQSREKGESMKPKTQIAIGKWAAIIFFIICVPGGTLGALGTGWGYYDGRTSPLDGTFVVVHFLFLGGYILSLYSKRLIAAVFFLLLVMGAPFCYSYLSPEQYPLDESTPQIPITWLIVIMMVMIIILMLSQGVIGLYRERRQSLIAEHNTKENNEQKE
jgi:hypothetical protein